MSKPALSVVMANYNHAQYISEALEAILAQSFRPLEVIIIDDRSTDNSIEVIEAFAKRDPIVHLVRNERNRGVVFSVNRASGIASGDYMYWAAADDKVLPGFFEKSMNLLAQYPQAGLCCSDPTTFDGHTGVVRENQLHLSDGPHCFSPDELVELMRRKPFHIAGHTSVVKRSAFVEAGSFIPELRWHCDWFALLVIAFRHGICYVPEPLAALRLQADSYSASGRRDWSVQREVLDHLLRLLESPAYRDVRPLFERSGVLATFQLAILRVILSNPEHRDYLSPDLVRRALWNAAWGVLFHTAARIAPAPVKRAYRNIREKRHGNRSVL